MWAQDPRDHYGLPSSYTPLLTHIVCVFLMRSSENERAFKMSLVTLIDRTWFQAPSSLQTGKKNYLCKMTMGLVRKLYVWIIFKSKNLILWSWCRTQLWLMCWNFMLCCSLELLYDLFLRIKSLLFSRQPTAPLTLSGHHVLYCSIKTFLFSLNHISDQISSVSQHFDPCFCLYNLQNFRPNFVVAEHMMLRQGVGWGC